MSIIYIVIVVLFLSIFRHDIKFNFKRDNSTLLKGILSIMIVLLHSWKNYIVDSFWGIVIVSIFMFITGYGLMSSYKKKGKSYLDGFLHHRLLKLLPPLVIATVVYMAIWGVSGHGTIVQWVDKFIQTGIPPIGATWYVFSVIFYYLFFYVAMMIGRTIFSKVVILTLLSFLFIGCVKHVFMWDDFWWCSSFAFLVGVVYQQVEGILLGVFKTPILYRMCAISLISALVACIIFYNYYDNKLFLYFLINILPIALVFIIYKFGVPNSKVLTFVGLISYELYIVHDVFISFLYAFPPLPGYLRFMIVISLSIPAAYLLSIICKKINSNI